MRRAALYVTLLALLLTRMPTAYAQTEGDPGAERGFKPELAYDFNGFDNVNLSNGNLMATIPLGRSYPVSDTLSYSFALRYTGNLWNATKKETTVTTQDPNPAHLYSPRGDDNAGLGWRLSFGDLHQGATVDYNEATSAPYRYRYISPDGGSHYFWDTLHEPVCNAGQTNADNCDRIEPGFSYTRDGSYLRMRVAGTARIVEFPNGERHRFLPGPVGLRLDSIYTTASAVDAFGTPTSNYVKFDYATANQWTVRDSHNREHRVVFSTHGEVQRVELAAFAFVTATYTLTTEQHTIKRPCLDAPEEDLDKQSPRYFLKSLVLPNGETWAFGYDLPVDECSDTSATMTSATFPTGGRVEWTYASIYTVDSPTAVSVTQRSLFDAAGTETGRKLYRIGNAPTKVSVETQVRVGSQWRTEVRVDEYRNRTTGALAGLPFTTGPGTNAVPNPDEDGRYLSSETFQCNPVTNTCPTTPDRATYVKYEMDQKYESTLCLAGNEPCEVERNRRVISTRTLYVSDLVVSEGITTRKFFDTHHSRFDGLGNYRQTDTDDNFDGDHVRTTTAATEYNAGSGDYKVDGNGNRMTGYTTPSPFNSAGNLVPWLLGTYQESAGTESGVTAKRLYCFDSATGLLKRQRVLAGTANGSTDLLSVFTRGTDGNLTREEYFGGDKQVPYSVDNADLCAVTLPLEHDQYSYRINHGYSRGVRNRTWYSRDSGSAMPFDARNDTIDASTGLVQSSRDTAGVQTEYVYDEVGRLTDVLPTGLAATRYAFSNATAELPASVTVTTGIDPTDEVTDPTDTVTTYIFDSLGRVRDEKRLMPDGTWSMRRTVYDDTGRRASVSELEAAPATGELTPSHRTELSGYDAYGRVGSVKSPDGKTTTFTYTGGRLTKRTQKVATSETGESDVSTTEEVDGAGRLVTVLEINGAARTTYGYDVGNRLTTVSIYDGEVPQNRWFTYDLRGLLTSEIHPESGTTSYEYDARGHVVKRTGGVSTITTAYDDAERVKTVKHGEDTIKEFSYDRANSGTDKSQGKLDRAKRYNRAAGDEEVGVTEKYIYSGPAGLLSRRENSLDTGEKFAEEYAHDVMGNVETLSYPRCEATVACAPEATPARQITSAFSHGSTTRVGTYTSDTVPIAYHPNGFLASVQHLNVDGEHGPRFTQAISATNGMARPESIAVTNYCNDLRVDPIAARTVDQGQPANLTVSAPGATEYQWYEVSGTESTAINGQNSSTLTVPVLQATTYWVRAGNGSCSVDSEKVTVSVVECPPINASISAPAQMISSTTGTASVPLISGATYGWTVTNGTIVSGGASRTVTFKAACTGSVTLSVTIQTSCRTETPTAAVTIQRFTATVSGPPAPIAQGSSADVQVALTGVGPWDLTWDDGFVQNDVPACGTSTCSATRTVTPNGTTTYRLSSALDAAGCSGTRIGNGPVTVIPPAPTSVTANAVSSTQVNVTWAFSGLRDSFDVYRAGGKIGSATGMSYTDTTAAAGTAYLYTVKAVKNLTPSTASSPDLATTVIFVDDPVAPFVTEPATQHLLQLRQAVNAVRRAAGLADASFTDTIGAGTIMRAVHVQELGTALNQARASLGLSQLAFLRWPLAGKSISASDINELRGGVK